MKRVVLPAITLAWIVFVWARIASLDEPTGQHERCLALEAVDGDTIHAVCSGKRVTVRLIGVDAPEIHYPGRPIERCGPEAHVALSALLGRGEIELEYDETSGRLDRYGRTLAYVWRTGENLDATMVRQGHARALTRYRFKRRAAFRFLEEQARREKIGVWDSHGCMTRP